MILECLKRGEKGNQPLNVMLWEAWETDRMVVLHTSAVLAFGIQKEPWLLIEWRLEPSFCVPHWWFFRGMVSGRSKMNYFWTNELKYLNEWAKIVEPMIVGQVSGHGQCYNRMRCLQTFNCSSANKASVILNP